jgi:NADH:ubiquinone oxidoreductase subunit 2 (subunit N)
MTTDRRNPLMRLLFAFCGLFYIGWESREATFRHFTRGAWSWVYFIVGAAALYWFFGKE